MQALPAAIVAPQPSASKVTPVAAFLHAHRDPDEVTARRAAGAADERAVRHGPAPMLLSQMLLEGMHPTESR